MVDGDGREISGRSNLSRVRLRGFETAKLSNTNGGGIRLHYGRVFLAFRFWPGTGQTRSNAGTNARGLAVARRISALSVFSSRRIVARLLLDTPGRRGRQRNVRP